MSGSFQRTLDHIRSIADSEAQKGRLFERLMKTYFLGDPLYSERFSNVRPLVRMGRRAAGFRRRRYGDRSRCRGAPGRLLRHPVQVLRARYADLEAPPRLLHRASARDPFTARIVVDTGDGWGAERPQDHRAAEARLHRAPLRRPREPAFRLARLGAAAHRKTLPSATNPSACGATKRLRSTT